MFETLFSNRTHQTPLVVSTVILDYLLYEQEPHRYKLLYMKINK